MLREGQFREVIINLTMTDHFHSCDVQQHIKPFIRDHSQNRLSLKHHMRASPLNGHLRLALSPNFEINQPTWNNAVNTFIKRVSDHKVPHLVIDIQEILEIRREHKVS